MKRKSTQWLDALSGLLGARRPAALGALSLVLALLLLGVLSPAELAALCGLSSTTPAPLP